MERILIIDDEKTVGEFLTDLLKNKYYVETTTNPKSTLKKINNIKPDLILLDIKMPGINGLEVLEQIKDEFPFMTVIMITAVKEITTAVSAMKKGAFDYITKPFEIQHIRLIIEKAIEHSKLIKEVNYLKDELHTTQYEYSTFIGKSKPILEIKELIKKVAVQNVNVLITGESGTGKELVARSIHNISNRSNEHFIAINCASIPDNLLESELFGYEKGAFTGATSPKAGKFELANKGTLFLDEIGNLKLQLQSKILRAIQEREIERLGGLKVINIDVRIISATNSDLIELIQDGTFREDLFYRLNVIPIHLPPLRDRKKDIPLLIEHFLKIHSKKLGKHIKGITPETQDMLINYNWPGNIRELENVIERAVVISDEDILKANHIFLTVSYNNKICGDAIYNEILPLKEAINTYKNQYFKKVWDKCNGDKNKIAKFLDVDLRYVYSLMKKFHIAD